jgi:hypothetical protein
MMRLVKNPRHQLKGFILGTCFVLSGEGEGKRIVVKRTQGGAAQCG